MKILSSIKRLCSIIKRAWTAKKRKRYFLRQRRGWPGRRCIGNNIIIRTRKGLNMIRPRQQN
jgi:hypothetical protein